MSFLLTVSCGDDVYENEIDYDITSAFEEGEIGYEELFEYADAPYPVGHIGGMTDDDVKEMTSFTCVAIEDEE